MKLRPDVEQLLGPPSVLARPLRVTVFGGKNVPQGAPKTLTLQSLARTIESIDRPRKDDLPLIALCRFAHHTRHAANLETCDGAEGDYDGEQIAIEEAARRLREAGIAAFLYTSPSHTGERPRWRVMAPFGSTRRGSERAAFLARLNGVLGGILAPESFDQGRSYYIGCVRGVVPDMIYVDGDAIDMREDLASSAIGKIPTGPVKPKAGEADRSVYLTGIAASCRQRGLSFEDFEREAMAHPIARDRVLVDESGKARTPARAERTLRRAWDWAERNVQPFFEDMSGVTPGGGDIENGKAFAERYHGKFKFVAKSWLRWDGQRWAPCSRGENVEAAKALAGEMLEAAMKALRDSETATAKARHTGALQTFKDHRKLAAMLKMAESEPRIVATVDQFDRDPWIVGVRNGLADIRSGELIRPSPDQLVSKQLGAEFDVNAGCPRWLEFLERVLPDVEVRRFVQCAVGYTLVGLVDEEKFFFMRGHGANGKSVFANVLTALFGDYAATLGAELLVKTKHDSDFARALARLSSGPRLVLINEVARGDVWDDAKIKMVASREKIAARRLYGESFDFHPTHTIWIRGNHAPGSHDAGHAFWRRLVPIEFNVSIPPHSQVQDLDRRIIERELPGVLTWALEGARRWEREGRLYIPDTIENAKRSYRAATDIVGQWLAERTTPDPNARTLTANAFADFREFCISRGTSAGYMAQFTEAMRERGYSHRGSRRDGRNVAGLALNHALAEKFK